MHPRSEALSRNPGEDFEAALLEASSVVASVVAEDNTAFEASLQKLLLEALTSLAAFSPVAAALCSAEKMRTLTEAVEQRYLRCCEERFPTERNLRLEWQVRDVLVQLFLRLFESVSGKETDEETQMLVPTGDAKALGRVLTIFGSWLTALSGPKKAGGDDGEEKPHSWLPAAPWTEAFRNDILLLFLLLAKRKRLQPHLLLSGCLCLLLERATASPKECLVLEGMVPGASDLEALVLSWNCVSLTLQDSRCKARVRHFPFLRRLLEAASSCAERKFSGRRRFSWSPFSLSGTAYSLTSPWLSAKDSAFSGLFSPQVALILLSLHRRTTSRAQR